MTGLGLQNFWVDAAVPTVHFSLAVALEPYGSIGYFLYGQ